MSSIPAITMGAFRNDLKPSIADNRNFTRRLACSTILFRYLQQRILAGLFQQKLETRHGPSNPWNRVRLTSVSVRATAGLPRAGQAPYPRPMAVITALKWTPVESEVFAAAAY